MPNDSFSSFTNPALVTGRRPTPSPAFVKARARASAAFAHANHGWFGSSAVHGLPTGYATRTPSPIAADWTPERDPSMNCARQPPTIVKAIAISLARFCASASGATWVRMFVPANDRVPANHAAALGGPSIPITPTCRRDSTVWRDRSSACSTVVSCCSAAAFSLAWAATKFASAALASAFVAPAMASAATRFDSAILLFASSRSRSRARSWAAISSDFAASRSLVIRPFAHPRSSSFGLRLGIHAALALVTSQKIRQLR